MERVPPPKTGSSSLLGEDSALNSIPSDSPPAAPGQDLDAALGDALVGDISALPPHLRGPQASPSPPPPSPWGRIVGGTAALLVLGGLGIFVYGKVNAPEEPAPAVEPVATEEEEAVEPAPGTKALPGVQRAKDWELIAESLSEVERHVSRAGLAFADFQAPALPEPEPEPEALPVQEAGEAPPPAPPPRPAPVDPELQSRWAQWQKDWKADLDYAQKHMPNAAQIDRSLIGAHSAVMNAISAARRVPGMPPTHGEGDAFVARVRPTLKSARQAVDAARR